VLVVMGPVSVVKAQMPLQQVVPVFVVKAQLPLPHLLNVPG